MSSTNSFNAALISESLDLKRNFCIVAHIDHGKSTLADRLIEVTDTVTSRDMRVQMLDNMDIERERGITIKLQTVRMYHTSDNGECYKLHLIDTPGHVDFSYEVSRSLSACEGAILLVDATQGVQAQTIANLKLAMELGLVILPVINKIDSPLANESRVLDQLANIEGIDLTHVCRVSGKTGEGVDELLNAIVKYLPPPSGTINSPALALVFDSHYDAYAGAILHVRVVNGTISAGTHLAFYSGGSAVEVQGVGIFAPAAIPKNSLGAGDVGYISTGLKAPDWVRVGDTLVSPDDINKQSVIDYQPQKAMVFVSLFPADRRQLTLFQDSFRKLVLNDAAIHIEPEVSTSMGVGYRCGFLGLLHMDITQERLRREFGVEVVATAPSVPYRAYLNNGAMLEINSPQKMPALDVLKYVEELFVKVHIFSKSEYIGGLIDICQRRRGIYDSLNYENGDQAVLIYNLPLGETVLSFFDELKSLTSGFASVDMVPADFRRSELIRVDILVDTISVDAFTFISHQDSAQARAAKILVKLKHTLPRRLYSVLILTRHFRTAFVS